MDNNTFDKINAMKSNVVGRISGDGKNITYNNNCSPLCRQMVDNFFKENQFLKSVIEDLKKDKAFLIQIIEDKNNITEEIRSEIELVRKMIEEKE